MSHQYYNENAQLFIENTGSLDLSEHYKPFLANIPDGGHILDAGCGSGRDSLAFLELGYQISAFDLSEQMVISASALTGIDVKQSSFDDFSYDINFDGIWACASLLHVKRTALSAALDRLAAHLKPNGVIFTSFKLGSDEREQEGRYFNDMDEPLLKQAVNECDSLKIKQSWIAGSLKPGNDEKWLISLLIKQE